MADPAFQTVTLKDRWPEATDLFGLAIDLAGTDLAATFRHPGQYVQVRTPAGRIAYLAIASRPGEPHFELLLKSGAEATDELIALAPGATFEMTEALGQGYPLQPHSGKDVLLFAVGSGIAPIRSLLWYLAAHRDEYQGVTLFFGARTPAHFAYQDELDAWMQAGIQVVRVVSQPDGTTEGYVHGYVQNAVKLHPLKPAATVAFVCGMREMVEGVTRELTELGVSPDCIFQNF